MIYQNSIIIKSYFPYHLLICKDLPLSCIVNLSQGIKIIYSRLIPFDYELIRNLVFCNINVVVNFPYKCTYYIPVIFRKVFNSFGSFFLLLNVTIPL